MPYSISTLVTALTVSAVLHRPEKTCRRARGRSRPTRREIGRDVDERLVRVTKRRKPLLPRAPTSVARLAMSPR